MGGKQAGRPLTLGRLTARRDGPPSWRLDFWAELTLGAWEGCSSPCHYHTVHPSRPWQSSFILSFIPSLHFSFSVSSFYPLYSPSFMLLFCFVFFRFFSFVLLFLFPFLSCFLSSVLIFFSLCAFYSFTLFFPFSFLLPFFFYPTHHLYYFTTLFLLIFILPSLISSFSFTSPSLY